MDGDEELVASRLPRWLVLTGVGALAVGVVAAVVIRNAGHHTGGPAPSPSAVASAPSDLAALSVQDLAMDAGGGLYALTTPPEHLLAVEPDGAVRGRAAVPTGARLVVANRTSDLVWVLAPRDGGTDVFVYAGSTMAGVSWFHVPATVAAAAALDNQLWTATDHGVYRGPHGASAIQVRGYTGDVQVIAADPVRFRLLAVSTAYDLIVVDAGGAHVARRLDQVLPESIAVTRDGIWLVGFGRPFGTRLARLDPDTLRVTPVGAPDPQAPEGATAWAGAGAVWIKYPYSGSVVCVNARTGDVTGAFTNTDTPVASVRGLAYALRGSGVVRLPTTAACPG